MKFSKLIEELETQLRESVVGKDDTKVVGVPGWRKPYGTERQLVKGIGRDMRERARNPNIFQQAPHSRSAAEALRVLAAGVRERDPDRAKRLERHAKRLAKGTKLPY